MKQYKNILVNSLVNLGDVVLTTSALVLLRQAYPSAKITMMVRPVVREAEENQAELSPEISHGVGLSVSVLQGEVWPEGFCGLFPSCPLLDC